MYKEAQVENSSVDSVYKLLESVTANKVTQNNIRIFSSLFPGLFVSEVPSILHTQKNPATFSAAHKTS